MQKPPPAAEAAVKQQPESSSTQDNCWNESMVRTDLELIGWCSSAVLVLP
jgi:hypothetical protein